ncbi:hypothetical protein [Bradyrhizobium sp. McL0615]|uniref:hypothetical protein n=1 Tax=Bradyrhizobium sp. McL0615 TaxID=3415673 RepID=UPI003CF7073A
MALDISVRAFVMETGTITLSGPSSALADDPRIRRGLSWRVNIMATKDSLPLAQDLRGLPIATERMSHNRYALLS